MEIPSAAYQRVQRQLAPIRECDPEDRQLLYAKLKELIRGVTIRKIEGDLLKHILDLREDFGSVVYIADLSEQLGENHYPYPILHLLQKAEEREGRRRIIPGKTRIVETTSGSLGVSVGILTKALGYQDEIIIPDALSPARKHRVEEFNRHGTVTVSSSGPGFIKGMTIKLQERMKQMIEERATWHCLNHSRNPETIEGFRMIGEEIRKALPTDLKLDALACGEGNATSIHGIFGALSKDPRCENMVLTCFKDAAGPNEPVAMEGVGGQHGVDFPFIHTLPAHQLYEWKKSDWWDIYERHNKETVRPQTIGHSSAGSLQTIRRIIEQEHRTLNLLGLYYNKADTSGSTLVTSDTAMYLQNEQWSDGIQLSESR